MSIPIDQLSKALFQKDSLAHCSVLELQQLVNQYPYFGPAHILMTEKLKSGDQPIYNNNLKKTFLYFNNPFWYQNLLSETGDEEIVAVSKTENSEGIQEEKKTDLNISNNKTVEKKEDLEGPILKMDSPDSGIPELTFEPFHTIDYFASQGIKFSEEEKPTDRLGQQLKSFTAWLKTMKRIPEPESTTITAVGTSSQTDKKVEYLAEHSIEKSDIETEAMAEVWEKQGNKEKAIAIYHKLSLRNPAKSPYFAAKIDQIKKTI